VTVWSDADDTITITWTEPVTNGGDILSYEVMIRHGSGLSYSTELVNCDGSDSGIMASLTCVVPVSVLKAEPFSLDWGAEVYAKVSATNLKGRSSTSNAGNGGIIITYPDAPVNILEDLSGKTPTSIGFTWEEGLANGGESVDNYRVSIAEQGGVFSILVSELTYTFYTATSLTTGVTYEIKIEA
jgi:hypothetical protein